MHAGVAELLAAFAQDAVEPLQHAEAELAFALDRDDAGVRQAVGRVPLELDAFLEVDEVQFGLVRAVREREVGDERVQQRRFAGAGFAGDDGVLGGAAAEREDCRRVAPARPTGTSKPFAALAFQISSGFGAM